MPDQINVTFACNSCGADPATLELPDDPTDDSIARCKHCGVEVGRYGDIVTEAKRQALADIRQQARNIFKGLKGWKMK